MKKSKSKFKNKVFRVGIIVIFIGIIAVSLFYLGLVYKDKDVKEEKNEAKDIKILKPDAGVYIGSYTEDSGLEEFEASLGYQVHISPDVPAYLDYQDNEDSYVNDKELSFNTARNETLWQEGYLSFISLQFPMVIMGDEYTVDDVIEGKADEHLRNLARQISEWGKPIFWLYQKDPEETFYGYGEDGSELRLWGNNQLPEQRKNNPIDDPCDDYFYQNYGDVTKLDGVERYIDLNRHIHDVIEEEMHKNGGVSNITWVMGGNDITSNFDSKYSCLETSYSDWYIGETYVDWHGVILYPYVKDSKDWKTVSFSNLINTTCSQIQEVDPSKPIMITELGVTRSLEDYRDDWFNEFFYDLKNSYNQIGAIIYYQDDYIIDKGVVDSDSFSRILYDSDEADAWKEEISKNPDFWKSEVVFSENSDLLSGRHSSAYVFSPEKEVHENLSGNGLLKVSEETIEFQGYFYLTIESLGISDIPIQANVDGKNKSVYMDVIGRTPAHFLGTKLPGDLGNVVVYGHSVKQEELSYFPDQTSVIFTYLFDLSVNDEIKLVYMDKTFIYKVYKTEEVSPKKLDVLYDVPGERTLTFFTCSPPGSEENRLVVVARQIN